MARPGGGGTLVTRTAGQSKDEWVNGIRDTAMGNIINPIASAGARVLGNFAGTGDVAHGASRVPHPGAGLAPPQMPTSPGNVAPGTNNIHFNPLEITVNFKEPFDQKVRVIADQRIAAAQRGQVRAGASGNSTP
jgi:hypothetical protein